MPDTIIQTYLNNQFITTDDSETTSKLGKAAKDVATMLAKKKTKIIPYTLVAIDPLIAEDDPVILEVEKIIIKKWSVFKNSVSKTSDKATTYIRIVILEALTQLSKDANLTAIIWHTGRDVFSFYKVSNEQSPLSDFLKQNGNQTEKVARSLWSNSGLFQQPTISIPELIIVTKIANETHLIKKMTSAAGPNSDDVGTSNGYWPNNQGNWSKPFGQIAGKAIASTINSVLKEQNKSITDISNQLNTILNEQLAPFLESIGSSVSKRAEATNKRSELLWWKQTLYSPSSNNSYRKQDLLSAALSMSNDLAEMVNPIYPISVDFLLKETLKDVHGAEIDELQSIGKWIEKASKLDSSYKALFQPLANNAEGRKSLTVALANSFNSDAKVDIFKETGIDKEAEISLGDLAIWIFHDLQAMKLTKA